MARTRTAPLLPKELTAKCYLLVERCHKGAGLSGLPGRIVTKNNMIALISFDSRMAALMGSTSTSWKMRIVCWVAAMVLVISAWIFSWWWLGGLIVVILLERVFARLEQRNWFFMSSMLLSLEVLVNDFAGWGAAYPEAKMRALEALEHPQTELLDFYLPRRANIDAATLKGFGPSGV